MVGFSDFIVASDFVSSLPVFVGCSTFSTFFGFINSFILSLNKNPQTIIAHKTKITKIIKNIFPQFDFFPISFQGFFIFSKSDL